MPEAQFAEQPELRRTSKHSFRAGWRWCKGTTEWFIRETSRLDLERPVLHVCSGSSRLGDVRVDAHHDAANLKADMYRLPFQDGAFPTIICDPPYDLNIQDRSRLGKELARVHAAGGRLLWKAPWLPFEGLYHVHDVTVQNIRAGLPRNAHLLVRATRRHPTEKPSRPRRVRRPSTSLPDFPAVDVPLRDVDAAGEVQHG